MHRLSEEFIRLGKECKGRSMSLKELMACAGPRSDAVITALCSFPFLFFIPLPGLSILFGLIVASAGVAIAMNRPIWLPKWMLNKKISASLTSKIFLKSAWVLAKIEKLARPRVEFFHRHPYFQRINGCLIALCGLILMLPLPPGTNFPPGLTSILISVGILEEDGVFIILGYVAFVATLFLLFVLPIIGYTEIKNGHLTH